MQLKDELTQGDDTYRITTRNDGEGVMFLLATNLKTGDLMAGSAYPEGTAAAGLIELNVVQSIMCLCCSAFEVDFIDEGFHYILSKVRSHNFLSEVTVEEVPILFTQIVESISHLHSRGFCHTALHPDCFLYTSRSNHPLQLSKFTTAQQLSESGVQKDVTGLVDCLCHLYTLAGAKVPACAEALRTATKLEDIVYSDFYRREVYEKLKCQIVLQPTGTGARSMFQINTYFGNKGQGEPLVLCQETMLPTISNSTMDAITAIRYPQLRQLPSESKKKSSTTSDKKTKTPTAKPEVESKKKVKSNKDPSTSQIKRLKVKSSAGLSGEDSALLWKIAKELAVGNPSWKDFKKMRPDSFYEYVTNLLSFYNNYLS